MSKTLKITLAISITLLLSLIITRFLFTFVDNYEYAYMFDSRTGETYPLINKNKKPMQGYIYSIPIIQNIHTFDTRPIQICIEGGHYANKRVLNCKLVSFNPKGMDLFLKWHGRDNYDSQILKDILMVYAYDQTKSDYPFLNFHDAIEVQSNQSQ